MQHYYGVDLGAVWTGGLSIRRLSALVAHLPVGSATWAAETSLPPGMTITDVVLTDIFTAVCGQPHPLRPAPEKQESPASESTEERDLFRRLKEQKSRIARERGDGGG